MELDELERRIGPFVRAKYLGLHRRGKRHDPLWEVTSLSIAPRLEHAAELLG